MEQRRVHLPRVMRNAVVYEMPSTAGSSAYEITVLRPPSGDTSGPHRILVVLDSPYVFGTVAESAYIQAMGGEIAPPVLVGIGTEGSLESHAERRLRDFTPPAQSVAALKASPVWTMLAARGRALGRPVDELIGGAGEFLDFICDRFLPRLPELLDCDVGDIDLLGHSAGAVFGRYALLSGRCPFSKLALGSLGVGWYGENLRAVEQAFVDSGGPAQPIDIFQGVGGAELQHPRFGPALQSGFDVMADLARRLPDKIRLRQSVFPGETHTSSLTCLASAALRTLYGVPGGFMDSL